MKIDVLPEQGYRQKMEEVTEYLKERGKNGFFDPDGRGNLYYESYQIPDAVGTIVLIHGFTENAEKYKELIYYFLQNNYQVYTMDMRGHGRSVRDTGDDLSLTHIDRFESYIADVEYLAELAKKENPDLPLYLFGHSMGGGVSAAVLQKRPELFKKAVLNSPMIQPLTGNIPFPAAIFIANLMVKLGKGKDYVAGQHGYQGDETFENSCSSCEARYEYYAEKRAKEKLFQNCGASYSWLSGAGKLTKSLLRPENCKKVKLPVLLFQAELDDVVSNDAQKQFVGKLPNAKLVVVPNTKHESYIGTSKTLEKYLTKLFTFLEA